MSYAPLSTDLIVPASMFDPELTYYADGTRVVVRGAHPAASLPNGRRGVAAGKVSGAPYAFQRVVWDDGGEDDVAPHVLARAVDPAKRGPAPLSTHPVAVLSARVVAARAMASRGNTLRPGAVLIPETPMSARAEYVAARERGETVPAALTRARAELVAHRVLTYNYEDTVAPNYEDTVAPWSDPLDTYDVDPRELSRVTSDPRTATLAGVVRDADTGELILSPVILPYGATARVYVEGDLDANPTELECYSSEDVGAWGDDRWRYVVLSAVVTLADGRRGEAALGGVETGNYWPGSEAAQIWHAVPDLIREAAGSVGDPDPENIPEDDRATCGTCGKAWNARTLPTPADRCPWEYEHEDDDDDELSDDTTEAFPGVRVTFYRGESDDRPVVHIDTDPGTAVRVNLNDGPALFDGRPDDDETPTANLAAWFRAYADELDEGRVTLDARDVAARIREVLDAEAAR